MPSNPIRIVVLSTGRQDSGILWSVVRALRGDERFAVALWAGGMHLSARFGNSVKELRRSLGEPARLVPFLSEPPEVGVDTGRALSLVHALLVEDRPDALLLVGDRSETLAAAFAASLARVSIVHLHGGEETEGAFDNALRHAITKLAHLHLVSHEVHARRVVQMGESPDRVVVIGAPGLDHLRRDDLPSRADLEGALGFPLRDPVILATLHPATLSGDPLAEVRALTVSLEGVDGTIVVTAPNADPGGEEIRLAWANWAAARPAVHLIDSLGDLQYWGMLRIASLLVGNSSSGLIEAPAAGVPAVNIGERQRGRLRGRGVVDEPAEAGAITAAIRRILDARAAGTPIATSSPFSSGEAAGRAVSAIAAWALGGSLVKSFYSITSPSDDRPLPFETLMISDTKRRAVLDRHEVAALCVSVEATLIAAIGVIENGGQGIALVCSAAGCLVGTLTDGDVRRALLAGQTTTHRGLTDIMHQDFVWVPPERSLADVVELMRARRLDQVPVLDGERRPIALHSVRRLLAPRGRENSAVILCGGRGVRLLPLTATVPKPMIAVAGRPILERLVLHLVGHGITDIYLAVNYLAHVIEEHFGDGHGFGCRIHYLREEQPLGTGGPLALLTERPSRPVIVVNGDLVTQCDLGAMLDFHEAGGLDATFGVRPHQVDIPYGVADVDGDRLVGLREKPSERMLINAGIYVLSPHVLDRVPRGEEFPITDLFLQLLASDAAVGAYLIRDDWIDVGQRMELHRARGTL